MSITNGYITAPVTIFDVYRALGLATQGGVYSVSYACGNSHGKINMWSRMKPVHLLKVLFTTSVTKWWRGQNGTCGITIPATSGPSLIPEKFTEDKKNGWEYEPPWGGENSPFRLTDFEGYYSDAHPPCRDFIVVNPEVGEGQTLNCGTIQYVPPMGDMILKPGSLSFSEISGGVSDSTGNNMSLEDWYLGVVVTDSSGAFKGRVTAENPGSGAQVKYPVTNLQRNVTYRVYPFLSKGKMTYGDQQQYQCVPLPNTAYGTFKVVTSEQALGLNILVVATQDNELARVDYSIKITSTKGDIKIHSMSCYLRFVENMFEDTTVNGESPITLPNTANGVTVSPTKPYETSGFKDGIYTNRNYKIQLYLNLGTSNMVRYYWCMPTVPPSPDHPAIPWQPDDSSEIL